jgi:cell division protein FtsQ
MQHQKSKKILLFLFLFLLIGTLNNKKLNETNFAKVNEINVIGLDEKNNLELKKKLDFLKINNLFFLNKFSVVEIINSNNLVEKYSVFKRYPSTLNIEIKKTKFFAQLKRDGNDFFLGSNGKLIKKKNIEYNIPYIFGNFKNKHFFELKKAINETNFNYDEIKNLFFFKSGRWDIETYSGILIKLPKENIKKSLELFEIVLSKNDKKIVTIDLRQQDQIIINER